MKKKSRLCFWVFWSDDLQATITLEEIPAGWLNVKWHDSYLPEIADKQKN